MQQITTWNYPTHIKFGAGAIKLLTATCQEFKIKNPLIVSDQGLVDLGVIDPIQHNLVDNGLNTSVFSRIKSNPNRDNVLSGLKQFRNNKHDAVIAVGGGSALDAGKAIALMSGQTKDLWEFEDIGNNYKNANPSGIAPTIAIPTTAGTGSEVGRSSVITDEAAKLKKIIFHPQMLPKCVLADPQLTIGLPPHLTAATGIDALIHNLEAFFSPNFHPMADGIAINGIQLTQKSLLTAYKDGNNLKARTDMLAASLMGATAFQKGLGAIHSLAHALGAHFDAHHGLLNAILAPYVISYNSAALKEKLNILEQVMFKGTNSKPIISFIDWLLQLRSDLGIPNNLSAIGIDDSAAEEIATLAFNDPTFATNPGNLTKGDLKAIFLSSI